MQDHKRASDQASEIISGRGLAEPDGPRIPKLWLALLVCLVVLLLLPFLWLGYGADADAWLVAHAARTLWDTGQYQVSRYPGFPLHEIVSAPLVGLGGSALSNTGTMVAALCSIVAWSSVAARWGRHPKLMVLALGFLPLLLVNATVTLDYLWSLLFVILALRAALNSRVTAAGIFTGIAAGFRPADLVLAVPLLVALHLNGNDRKQLKIFLLTTIGTAFVAFLPVLITDGPIGWVRNTVSEMSDVHPSLRNRLLMFGYRSVYAVGPLAFLVAVSITALRWNVIRRSIRVRDPIVLCSVTGLATFLLLFFLLPIERAYLLPAIPFFLLLIDAIASRGWFIALTLSLLSLAVVNPDIASHRGPADLFEFRIHQGRLIESLEERRDFLRSRQRIASLSLSGKSLVMTGGGIAFWFENTLVEPDTLWQWKGFEEKVVRSAIHPDVSFISYLRLNELGTARRAGYTVYCLKSAVQYVEPKVSYTVAEAGVLIIE